MAARGARSRKVVEKQITKESTKRDKDRLTSLTSPVPGSSSSGSHRGVTSPIAGWGRKGTSIVSSSASTHSTESMGSRLSNGTRTKIAGLAPSQQQKFVDKGKKTAAPRGRGGGVPVKLSEASSSSSTSASSSRAHIRSVKAKRSLSSQQGFRNESRANGRTSNGSQTLATSWDKTKVWSGGGSTPQQYPGFEHDEDMWMADGNCLIFFSEETDEDDPKPMLRVHTRVLEQARSMFMINLLKYGEIVVEDEETPPASNGSSPTSPNSWPLTEMSLGNLDELLRDDQPDPSLRPPSRRSIGSHTWSTSGQTYISGDATELSRTHGSVRVPPSIAEGVDNDPQEESSGPPPTNPTAPGEITHEIWFRAPSHIKRPDIQRRHHMATRNYLALLYGLPIVGNDFYQMLSDLQNVMDTYYELNEPSERWNSAQVIVQYLIQRNLDDIRGNPGAALGLMAWSEQSNVAWDAGYLEGFVHSVGMMSPETVKMPEFKNLSQVSRHKLQNAFNALQLRLIEAEERLERFDFPEIWYAEGTASNHPAQRAFEEFRNFLRSFYHSEYGQWPPKEIDHQSHWITRTLINRLQTDFGALYDYLVDRGVVWDMSEERHTRKWEMVCTTAPRGPSFSADAPGLPLTNMLVGFDSSMRYDHIPHPYPLLPVIAPTQKEKPAKRGLFGRLGKKETVAPGPKEQYQMALAFTAATNVNRLGSSLKENKLLDAFQQHERAFSPSSIPPGDARIGRWILLYSVLQILSTLSVDTIGLKYPDKIRYFACPSLEGCPPWRTASPSPTPDSVPGNGGPSAAGIMQEARQTSSYCWLAPQRWRSGADPALAVSTPPAYEMSGILSPNLPPGIGVAHPNLSELDGRGIGRKPSVRTPVILASSVATTPRLTPVLSPQITPRTVPMLPLSPQPTAMPVPLPMQPLSPPVSPPPLTHGHGHGHHTYTLDRKPAPPDVPPRSAMRDSPGHSPALTPTGKGYEMYRPSPVSDRPGMF